MKAKVTFYMQDRNEYTFDVEGDCQTDFYRAGLNKLTEHLGMVAATVSNPPTEFYLIESWRTVLETGEPGKDKTDGVATRSPRQKLRFDLLPIAPLAEVVAVFTFGAYQYGDRNWEEGFSWSRCIGSVWRHFTKWLLGEDRDDESDLHHLAHVIANCLFLLEYAFKGTGTDDRRKMPLEFIEKIFQPIDASITQEKDNE